MRLAMSLVVLVMLSGCTVYRANNLQVYALCQTDIVTKDGHFNEASIHHNHCDKRQMFRFKYSFK